MFVTSIAGRDATPDTQKEEIANTKVYEVPTSCDPQKKEGSIEMKEDLLYEVPPQWIWQGVEHNVLSLTTYS